MEYAVNNSKDILTKALKPFSTVFRWTDRDPNAVRNPFIQVVLKMPSIVNLRSVVFHHDGAKPHGNGIMVITSQKLLGFVGIYFLTLCLLAMPCFVCSTNISMQNSLMIFMT